MAEKRQREIIMEAKYAPPYPQSFYPFWPRHALKAGALVTLILIGLLLLSHYFRLPTDVNMPPMPDEGAYIPAPEWYLFTLFQPFWYWTGENAKWLVVGTFWLPLAVFLFLLSVPVIFRRKQEPRTRMRTSAKVISAAFAGLIWLACMGSVVGSGAPAKTQGCLSCHNTMMGVRQALPPANIAEYFRTERQRQVDLGGYNIGGQGGPGSYKDSNWQLRHFYEPTMTW